MKKTILISLLTVAAFSMNAQTTTTYNGAVCKRFPNAPANARPVWPAGTYTPTQDASCPPCYEYMGKYGHMNMECPYLTFPPEHVNTNGTVYEKSTSENNTVATTLTDERAATLQGAEPVTMQAQNSYTGNYPAVCQKFPHMPAGATPVWPKGSYTPTQDPSCPPCYEYTSKHGVRIMECPYLNFPAEHRY